MIKRRTRPQPRVREESPPQAEDRRDNNESEIDGEDDVEERSPPISELLELMRLRKQRQGIDVHKLSSGNVKKRRRRREGDSGEDGEVGGLRAGAGGAGGSKGVDEGAGEKGAGGAGGAKDEDGEEAGVDAKARRAVRTNNFTQQTNTLDVDKHMMAYIEENLKVRRQQDALDSDNIDDGDDGDEFNLAHSERWKKTAAAAAEKKKAVSDEGSVTNSMAMLTAIPEVDLGMDTRLRNIEETEKAKRQVAEERKERRKMAVNTDEEHLVATRFYRPHLKQKSDVEIMREAKLEAMGLPLSSAHEERRPRHDKPQMATDELVMERFKKRMRR